MAEGVRAGGIGLMAGDAAGARIERVHAARARADPERATTIFEQSGHIFVAEARGIVRLREKPLLNPAVRSEPLQTSFSRPHPESSVVVLEEGLDEAGAQARRITRAVLVDLLAPRPRIEADQVLARGDPEASVPRLVRRQDESQRGLQEALPGSALGLPPQQIPARGPYPESAGAVGSETRDDRLRHEAVEGRWRNEDAEDEGGRAQSRQSGPPRADPERLVAIRK